jgi:hypothetical protein
MLTTIRNFISNEVCGRKARFLIAYVIAAYACRIPAYFINWGRPDVQVSWWKHLLSFFMMPFLAPVYLYGTVRLTYLYNSGGSLANSSICVYVCPRCNAHERPSPVGSAACYTRRKFPVYISIMAASNQLSSHYMLIRSMQRFAIAM